MEVLTIGIFCALLIICIITGKSILYALLAGLIIFSLYGKKQGYSWRQISRMALQGAWKVKNILLTFILIGMLTALWRQAGTIPAIICYTVHLIKPSTFLLMTFLLNCLISVHRNCSWYGSHDWCCMCNDGFCTWNSFMDDRWCNSFRGIFRRSLFSCFDKCTSGGGADGDRYLYKYKKYDQKCIGTIYHYLYSLSDCQHTASWKNRDAGSWTCFWQ